MTPDIVVACSLQRAYFHKDGSKYLGDQADILKVRITDYLRSVYKSCRVFYIREVHQTNDVFHQRSKSYALVGTADVACPEVFKPFSKSKVNTARYSAFFKTPLDSELLKLKPKSAVLIGVETHTNVLFTAEELRNRDIDVTVIEALTGSSDSYMHAASINILSNVLSVNVQ